MKYTVLFSLLLVSLRAQAQDGDSTECVALSRLRQIDSMASSDTAFAAKWEFFVSHAVFVDEREGGNQTSFTLRDSISSPYVGVIIVTSTTDTGTAAKRFSLVTAKGEFYPSFLIKTEDTSYIYLNYSDEDMQNLLYCYLVTTHEAMHFYSYYKERNAYFKIRKWLAAEEYTAYLYSWQTLMNQVHNDTILQYFRQMVYGYMKKPDLYSLSFNDSPFTDRAEIIADAVSNYSSFVIVMAKLYSLPGGRRGERLAREILEDAGMVYVR